MDTGSNFLGGGGGWGGSFGAGSGGAASAGYSSGLLNAMNGFGQRSTPFVADTGQALGTQNAYTLQQMSQQAQAQQQLQAQQNAAELQRTQIQARAETLPARLGAQRFNKVFPYVTSTLNGLMGGGLNSLTSGFGGSGGFPSITSGAPPISTNPVYSDQMIQSRVNDMRAGNDQATAGQIRNIQEQTAGRGFGANSPLAQALAGQAQAANLATNTKGENDLRWNSALENSKQTLAEQEAAATQYQNLLGSAITQQSDAAKIKAGLLESVLGGMFGTLGSLGR